MRFHFTNTPLQKDLHSLPRVKNSSKTQIIPQNTSAYILNLEIFLVVTYRENFSVQSDTKTF